MINTHPENYYVHNWSEFNFCPGTLEAISLLSDHFSRIVVVTNQQGIGKQLISESEMDDIHSKMLQAIAAYGGSIDEIYYCPDLKTKENNCRKPGPKMAYRAQSDFPDISFHRSIMIGDQDTDILFGKDLGMRTIRILNDHVQIKEMQADGDYDSLYSFAVALIEDSPVSFFKDQKEDSHPTS